MNSHVLGRLQELRCEIEFSCRKTFASFSDQTQAHLSDDGVHETLLECSLPAATAFLLDCSKTIRQALELIVNILIMFSVFTGFSGGFNRFEFIGLF